MSQQAVDYQTSNLALLVTRPVVRGTLIVIGSALSTAAAAWALVPILATASARKLYRRHSGVRRRRGLASV